MAFPTIPTAGNNRIRYDLSGGEGTKQFTQLQYLTKNAGDLLIGIIIQYQGNSTNADYSSWTGGWTEFVDRAGTTTMAMGAAYKWSDGTETSLSVTAANSSFWAAKIVMAIAGAHSSTPPEATAMATGTAPNAAALNPSGWDTEDALWIAVAGSGETSLTGSYTGIGTAPTNYGNQFDTGISADEVGGIEGSVAFRQLNAASEDPGAWTMDTSNARGAALLIAVRPAPQIWLPPNLVVEPKIYPPQVIQQRSRW